MTITEASGAGIYRTGRAEPTAQRVERREQVEAVGLLVGILGVLLVVVPTFGTTPGLS